MYYVAPKLWVWGKGRIKHLREYVDRILAIFPFEEEFYRSRGMPVTYVGNPLTEIMAEPPVTGPSNTFEKHDDETVISLLPGTLRLPRSDRTASSRGYQRRRPSTWVKCRS